jgi:hypothetical protein
MRFAALAFALFCTTPALAADVFESQNAGYSLIYSDDWKMDEKNSTADNIALICVHELCEGTIRATVMAAPDYRYANDPPSKLFNRIHPDKVLPMVQANAAQLGTVKESQYPVRYRIGNVEGFIGVYKLMYFDRRIRNMIYGLILNRGYFYHIQILSPETPNPAIRKIIDGLLDGFQVNQSE